MIADRISYRLPWTAVALMGALLSAGCASDAVIDSVTPRPGDVANATGKELGRDGTMQALLRAGDATRAAGDPAGAVFLYRRAHAIDMRQADPLVKLGATLTELGAFNEAAEALRAALKIDPNRPDALRSLGHALIGLDQPQLALDQFDAALRLNPGDYRAYNGMGVAHDLAGDHRAAQAHYRVGLAETPDDIALQNNLALSLALDGDFKESIEILGQLTSRPEAASRHRLNLAMIYGLAGRADEAAQMARRDLPETQVQSNLIYYEMLRAMGDTQRTAAVFGIHVPANKPLPTNGQ